MCNDLHGSDSINTRVLEREKEIKKDKGQIMILLLCFLAYIPVFKNQYVTDDFTLYSSSPKKPKNILTRIWWSLKQKGYWGKCDKFAHAINLAIHFAVSISIYYAFGKNEVSYMAACLFAVNPVNSEVSLWLAGRTYGYQTLLALLLWMYPFMAIWIFSIAIVMPTMLSALTFFPLLFLTKSFPIALIAGLTIILAYNLMAVFKPGQGKLAYSNEAKYRLSINPMKFVIAIKFFGYNLVNSIFPMHTASYIGYMSEFAETNEGKKDSYKLDRYFFIGCLIIYILICNMIWNFNTATLGLLWYAVTIAMWCNFVNIGNMQLALRYNYLPNVGLMVALASYISGYPLLFGLFLGGYGIKLVYTMRNYKNDYWHSVMQTIDEPEYYYSWLLHGNMMFSRGHFTAAIHDMYEGLIFSPKNFKLHYNMSSAYVALKHYHKAILCLEKAKECELIGQEQSRQAWIKEREILIGRCIQAMKKGIRVELTINQIPIIV